MDDDLYKALGVGRDATEAEIKQAYREKAKKLHPDAGGDSESFALISLAKRILTSPEEREHYDRTGGGRIPRNEVESQVAAMLVEAFSSDDRTDPIKYVCRKIDAMRSTERESAKEIARKADRMQKKLDRFINFNKNTTNVDSRDLIIGAMENNIKHIRRQAKAAERSAELGTEMLTYLNDLRCPPEDGESGYVAWRMKSQYPAFVWGPTT